MASVLTTNQGELDIDSIIVGYIHYSITIYVCITTYYVGMYNKIRIKVLNCNILQTNLFNINSHD